MKSTQIAVALALVAASCGDEEPRGAFEPIPRRKSAAETRPEEKKVGFPGLPAGAREIATAIPSLPNLP